MNIQEASNKIEGWLEANASEGYINFEITEDWISITVIAKEE
jgi:hypothetical protein